MWVRACMKPVSIRPPGMRKVCLKRPAHRSVYTSNPVFVCVHVHAYGQMIICLAWLAFLPTFARKWGICFYHMYIKLDESEDEDNSLLQLLQFEPCGGRRGPKDGGSTPYYTTKGTRILSPPGEGGPNRWAMFPSLFLMDREAICRTLTSHRASPIAIAKMQAWFWEEDQPHASVVNTSGYSPLHSYVCAVSVCVIVTRRITTCSNFWFQAHAHGHKETPQTNILGG